MKFVELKGMLEDKLGGLQQLLEGLEEEVSTSSNVERVDTDSSHLAENAGDLMVLEYAAGDMASIRHQIADIRHSLFKLENHPDKVGKCERCLRDIDDARLKAKPWARYCRSCREQIEKTQPR